MITQTMPRDITLESQSLFNMALERIKRNNFKKALDPLIEALRISPGQPVYLSYFGLCIGQVDRNYDRALQHCQQAVDARPTDPQLYVNLGKVYKLSGKTNRAYQTLQHAWELDKKNAAVAAELTRMGIRRPPFLAFLPRSNLCNRYLGKLRASLERKLIGRRQS